MAVIRQDAVDVARLLVTRSNILTFTQLMTAVLPVIIVVVDLPVSEIRFKVI